MIISTWMECYWAFSIMNYVMFCILQYRERVIFIGQHIDEEFSNQVLATMLYLDSIESSKKIYLYINGPGGDVSTWSIPLFLIILRHCIVYLEIEFSHAQNIICLFLKEKRKGQSCKELMWNIFEPFCTFSSYICFNICRNTKW